MPHPCRHTWRSIFRAGGFLAVLGISLLTATTGVYGDERTDEPKSEDPAPQPRPAEAVAAEEDGPQESFIGRVRQVGDALRGLATWDLFGGKVTLRAYTRIQVDGNVARGNDELAQTLGGLDDNSLSIRRLNLYAAGTIDGHLDYEVGYLFGSDPSVWNAFVQGTGEQEGLKVFGYAIGKFRAGYFQEPFSIERITSSYYTGFAERSLPVWTFAPGNNVGYMVFDTAAKERISWAAGFFSFGQQTELNASNSNLSVDLKVTGRPLYRRDHSRILHLGLTFSNRQPSGNTVRYRIRPEARFVEFFADTGDIASAKNVLYQAEAAWVHGPLWAQSEVISAHVSSDSYGTLKFSGSYLQAGYFLTGEVRPFNVVEGYFGRVIPRDKNYALEVVGRISTIDLNDGPIQGGAFIDVSAGINWYLGSTSRVMAEIVHSKVDGGGKANIAILRYAWRPRSR